MKKTFSKKDEIEIEKFLNRTKQPLLLKCQKHFEPEKVTKIPFPFSNAKRSR